MKTTTTSWWGKKLFQQHCASCHGSTAEGKGKRPNLHSDAIRNAKPGELQWLLTNGNLGKGMPSWSRLPETATLAIGHVLEDVAVGWFVWHSRPRLCLACAY